MKRSKLSRAYTYQCGAFSARLVDGQKEVELEMPCLLDPNKQDYQGMMRQPWRLDAAAIRDLRDLLSDVLDEAGHRISGWTLQEEAMAAPV